MVRLGVDQHADGLVQEGESTLAPLISTRPPCPWGADAVAKGPNCAGFFANRGLAKQRELSPTDWGGTLVRDGPVDAIVDNVKRFVDVLARKAHVDVFLANIPADTPPAHVHAAVVATHTYGHLPIADDLSKMKLELPKRESFEEFMKTWKK